MDPLENFTTVRTEFSQQSSFMTWLIIDLIIEV